MIQPGSIDTVRHATDITEVVGKVVALKKAGASMLGCCPFHDEKTPSFHVFSRTQTYKCFGCGEGGDAIKFVMLHDKRTFAEAIEFLAREYNITLEYNETDNRETEKESDRDRMRSLLQFAWQKYEQLLWSLPGDAPVLEYLHERGYTEERIKKWGLGFAPANWKFLTTPLINKGRYNDALEAGIVRTKEGKNFDAFYNKIIFPLHDVYGNICGLSARLYTAEDAGKYKGNKYVNPSNNMLYDKSRYWYGLWQAIPAIKKEEHAVVVEGYTDVHAMHDFAGMENTIAACGTALTPEQVKLLKRYTNHVVLCYDGDEAGVKAMMKNIDLFLEKSFKVEVIELPKDLDPEGYLSNLLPACREGEGENPATEVHEDEVIEESIGYE